MIPMEPGTQPQGSTGPARPLPDGRSPKPRQCLFGQADVLTGIHNYVPISDLIVTSPPYNVGKPYDSSDDLLPLGEYRYWFRGWLTALRQAAPPGLRLAVNVPTTFKSPQDDPSGSVHMSVFELMPLFVETGWEFFAEVIWAKYQGVIDGDEMPTPGTSWGSFCSPSAPSFRTHTERIWFWYADKWKVAPPRDELRGEIIDRTEFAKLTKDLWVIKGEQHPTHPAVMASEVARRCIMLCTYPEAVVYDPFCGRGTTAIQAALQGRAGIGTDLSASYISLACREAQRAMVPATRVRLIA